MHSSLRLHTLAGLLLISGPWAAAQLQPAAAPDDEIVKLDAFTVTTALGRYAETNSSAGSKVPMELKELASSVQILNASFMQDLKARALDDLYPYVTGMTRLQNTANGFTMRGFTAQGSNLQSVQVDGLPGLVTRYGSPTTANIERVEVLKGPTSVLYGQNNPGGLINMVTKRPQQRAATEILLSTATYAGKYSSLGDDLSVTTLIDTTGPIDREGRWLYRLIASSEDLRPFRQDNYLKNYYFFPSLTYRWSERTSITFQGDITAQKRRADDGLVVPFNDLSQRARADLVYQEKRDVDRDGGAALTTVFQHHFANDWTLRATMRNVWHTDSRFAMENATANNPTITLPAGVTRRYRVQDNARRYNFVDANLYREFHVGSTRHTLLFGLNGGPEFSSFDRQAFGPNVPRVSIYAPVPETAYPTTAAGLNWRKTNFENYSAYVSDQIKLGNRWHATLGLRHDRQDSDSFEVYSGQKRNQSVSATVPNVGVVYAITPAASVYVSYVEGFKPSLVDAVDVNGKSGFPSEKSDQIEAGFKADFWNGKLSTTFAAYDINKTNVVETITGVFAPDGTQASQIFGRQRSKGAELQVAWLPIPNWQVLAGATYIDARVTKTSTVANVGARLAHVPYYSANVWTRYNVRDGSWKGFGAGAGFIYTDSRRGAVTNNPANFLTTPGYGRLDLALYYQWRRYHLSLNMHNALDREYISTAFSNVTVIPGEPRKLTFSVRALF